MISSRVVSSRARQIVTEEKMRSLHAVDTALSLFNMEGGDNSESIDDAKHGLLNACRDYLAGKRKKLNPKYAGVSMVAQRQLALDTEALNSAIGVLRKEVCRASPYDEIVDEFYQLAPSIHVAADDRSYGSVVEGTIERLKMLVSRNRQWLEEIRAEERHLKGKTADFPVRDSFYFDVWCRYADLVGKDPRRVGVSAEYTTSATRRRPRRVPTLVQFISTILQGLGEEADPNLVARRLKSRIKPWIKREFDWSEQQPWSSSGQWTAKKVTNAS